MNADVTHNSSTTTKEVVVSQPLDLPKIDKEEETQIDKSSNTTVLDENGTTATVTQGPKASEDSRFKKFFKMVQFGVPPQAVKLKMETEQIDPSILEYVK